MRDRLARVLWFSGQHQGLGLVEGVAVADLALLVGVGLKKEKDLALVLVLLIQFLLWMIRGMKEIKTTYTLESSLSGSLGLLRALRGGCIEKTFISNRSFRRWKELAKSAAATMIFNFLQRGSVVAPISLFRLFPLEAPQGIFIFLFVCSWFGQGDCPAWTGRCSIG